MQNITVNATLHTAGTGYWSSTAKAVRVNELVLSYINDEYDFGELCVYFNTDDWDISTHGLIYTDSKFMKELRKLLIAQGFSKAAAADVHYSEQGMQGKRYVSCDVGEQFISEFTQMQLVA